MTIAYLKLTRFPLVFTAAADSAVGAALSGCDLLHSGAWIPAVICSSLLYAAGMVLNDLVDIERDRTIHPERPLPSGRVGIRTAYNFAGILFVLALAVSGLGGLATVAWTGGIAGLIHAYNLALKRNAAAGSAGMALIRGANLGLGAVVAGASSGDVILPWAPMAILAGYVFFLTLWSTREEKPGRGREALAAAGAGMILVPLAGLALPRPMGWPLVAAPLWILPWVLRALVRPDANRLMQAVRWGVLGIIPLDASFLAAQGRWMEAAAVAGLLIPALALLPLFRKL